MFSDHQPSSKTPAEIPPKLSSKREEGPNEEAAPPPPCAACVHSLRSRKWHSTLPVERRTLAVRVAGQEAVRRPT